MPFRDLRHFIDFLECEGELVRVTRQVNAKFGIAGGIRKMSDQNGPALLFQNIEGYKIPVVGGLFATWNRTAMALGTTSDKAVEKFLKAKNNLLKPKLVSKAPCKECILTEEEVDLRKFPIPTHHERDAGPYITGGVQVSKDPQTKIQNAGIYRQQVKGRSNLVIHCSKTSHLRRHFDMMENQGNPLELAIAIGLDPAIHIAAAAKVPYGLDEIEVAGGLRENPVEVVKCETVDITVPATSEIVIEGKMLPNIREPEGPFADICGQYESTPGDPVIQISAITHRYNPIFQTIFTGFPITENHILNSLTQSALCYEDVISTFPGVKAVNISPAGCSFHAVLSLKQSYPSEAKRLILAVLGKMNLLRRVVVVDEDIDVFDDLMVEWALATRVNAEQDIIVLPRVGRARPDPSATGALTSVYGIDATIPCELNFDLAKVPGADKFEIP